MEPRRLITPRRVLLSLLLAGAVGGFLWSFAVTESNTPPVFTDQAVEAVHPGEGQLDVRQARIGIDLKPGYEAVLRLDRIDIPEDQLERIPELGQTFYTPGPDKITGAITPGRHCATASFWDPTQGGPETGRKYSWCFTAH
jgi:hypothetical protein